MPACSKSEPYYLLVKVSLDANLPQEPDSVRLTATQNETEFKRATLSWSLAKEGVLEVGLALPSDTTHPVVVTGVAYLGIQPVGQGTATFDVKVIKQGQNSDPISLVIYPFSGTAGDGGGVRRVRAARPWLGTVPSGDRIAPLILAASGFRKKRHQRLGRHG